LIPLEYELLSLHVPTNAPELKFLPLLLIGVTSTDIVRMCPFDDFGTWSELSFLIS